jgi:sugar lactone lactonase YvrE
VIALDPDGTGEVWHAGPFTFANGLAFSADGTRLYVVETFRHAVSVIDVEEDGSAGAKRDLVTLPGVYPDGLAVAEDGSVLVGCYQPSQILRVRPDGQVEVVGEDVSAHLLAHPTNIAFQGDALLAANLGRWHITKLEVGLRGVPLPPPARSLAPTSPGAGS